MDIIQGEYTAVGISAEAAQSLLSEVPPQPTSLHERIGLAGVSQGKLIPFRALYNPS